MPKEQPPSNRFRELLNRCFVDQDPEAAREVVQRYTPHLLAVIRRRLDGRLRPLVGGSDIAQDAWVALLERVAAGAPFVEERQFLAFVTGVVENKVRELHRKHLALQRHDLKRQQSLESVRGTQDLADREPNPLQAVAGRDEWHQLLERFTEQERQIAELLIDGDGHRAIADRLGLNERTVRRTIVRLEERLREILNGRRAFSAPQG
jgi:RNA polymerase sigma factor (sigma-70 family)